MNRKSLSAQNKTHKQILSFLKDRKISKVYSEFSSSLNSEENLAVAVSGGPIVWHWLTWLNAIQ